MNHAQPIRDAAAIWAGRAEDMMEFCQELQEAGYKVQRLEDELDEMRKHDASSDGQAEDAAKRIDELTAERDELRARLEAIEDGTPVEFPGWSLPVHPGKVLLGRMSDCLGRVIDHDCEVICAIINDYANQVARTKTAEARVAELEAQLATAKRDGARKLWWDGLGMDARCKKIQNKGDHVRVYADMTRAPENGDFDDINVILGFPETDRVKGINMDPDRSVALLDRRGQRIDNGYGRSAFRYSDIEPLLDKYSWSIEEIE